MGYYDLVSNFVPVNRSRTLTELEKLELFVHRRLRKFCPGKTSAINSPYADWTTYVLCDRYGRTSPERCHPSRYIPVHYTISGGWEEPRPTYCLTCVGTRAYYSKGEGDSGQWANIFVGRQAWTCSRDTFINELHPRSQSVHRQKIKHAICCCCCFGQSVSSSEVSVVKKVENWLILETPSHFSIP